ncbi:MAG: hypothetical protein ABL906_04705 [Sideroxydans sp.]
MPNSKNISNEFVETAYTSKQIEKINEAECRIDCAFLNGIEATPLLENGVPFEKKLELW